MIDRISRIRENGERGIGSPASHKFSLLSTWDVVRVHLVCARSMTRFCRARTRPALIGSQAVGFMESYVMEGSHG